MVPPLVHVYPSVAWDYDHASYTKKREIEWLRDAQLNNGKFEGFNSFWKKNSRWKVGNDPLRLLRLKSLKRIFD